MSRTQARFESDSAYPDGLIPLMPGADIVQVGAGTTTLTRIAAGEYAFVTSSATTAYTFVGGVTGVLLRGGAQDNLQEFWGSSRAGGAQGLAIGAPQTFLVGGIVAGTLVNVTVQSTVGMFVGQKIQLDTVASGVQEYITVSSITSATVFVAVSIANTHATGAPVWANVFTTPAGASGFPPFTGLSQLTPQTSFRPKGLLLKAVSVIYQVVTTAITVPTIGLYSTQYNSTVAPTVTTLIAQATNGLTTAANAQPIIVTIPVPIANQAFTVTPNTILSIEFDFTSGGANGVNFFGFVVQASFNYD
jgi:hypothetical protein